MLFAALDQETDIEMFKEKLDITLKKYPERNVLSVREKRNVKKEVAAVP